MPHKAPAELTDAQLIALTMLSEQRGANLIQLADVIGDMNQDGLEFLRRLGDPRFEKMTHFLTQAKPETFELLGEMRPEEVDTLKYGLRLVVAVQLLGKVAKWSIVTLFSAFVGMALIWDKVSAWLKGR